MDRFRVEEGWVVITPSLPPHRPHRAQLTQRVPQREWTPNRTVYLIGLLS